MGKKTSDGNMPWEPKHDALIITGMIDLIKQNKKQLYLLPGIVGEVDGHGNSRTSAKIDSVLKALARANGVDVGVVDAGKRRVKSGGSGTPVKREGKRGRQDEDPDEDEDQDQGGGEMDEEQVQGKGKGKEEEGKEVVVRKRSKFE